MGTRALGGRSSAVAVVLLALLTGCGGDSSAERGERSEPSSSPTSSASPGESAEPSPSVTPASGPVLDAGVATISAPEGFERARQLVRWMHGASEPGSPTSVDIAVVPADPGKSLREQARSAIRNGMTGNARQLPSVTLDGVTFFRVVGRAPDGLHVEEYGTITTDGDQVAIKIDVAPGTSGAEREELVSSVLASFRWVE